MKNNIPWSALPQSAAEEFLGRSSWSAFRLPTWVRKEPNPITKAKREAKKSRELATLKAGRK